MARILYYEEKEIGRIHDIRKSHVRAWLVVQDGCRPPSSNPDHKGTAASEVMRDSVPSIKKEPRICPGKGYMIDLVPATWSYGSETVIQPL